MLTLRPYQQEAIRNVLHDWGEGYTDVLGTAATGSGKAQPLDAKVLTPAGWRRMGDLKIGDQVIGSDGKPHRVLGVFPQGRKDIWRVTFSDGAATECCADHLWAVQTKSHKHRGQGFTVKPLRNLMGDLVDGSGANKWFAPLVAPVELEERAVPIDPYVLGALLGDGYLHQTLEDNGSVHGFVCFATVDTWLRDEVERRLGDMTHLKHVSGCDYHVTDGKRNGRAGMPLLNHLRDLDLMGRASHEKFVPDLYKYNSVAVRLAVLQGLMDTDGSGSPTKAPVFCSTSRQMADDVCEIVRSLGGATRVRRRRVRGGRDAYRVTISLPMSPFRLPRKVALWNPKPTRGRTRAIVGMERVGSAECQCILVDAPDHLYVTDDYVVTHNTCIFLALMKAVLDEEPDKRWLILAHRKELIEQPIERLQQFFPMLALKAGIVMANHDECERQIVVATVQTLSSEKRLARVMAHGAFDYVITDECFVASTMVDDRPIESIRVGDTVSCVGPEGLTKGTVTEKHERPAPDTLYAIEVNGHRTVCTGNHPFWKPEGWVAASDLSKGDYVGTRKLQAGENVHRLRGASLGSEHREVPALRGAREASGQARACMLRVRQDVHGDHGAIPSVESGGEGLLLEGVVQNGQGTHVVGTFGADQSQVCLGAYEAQQPDGRSEGACQDEANTEEYRPSPAQARWERSRANSAAEESCTSVGLADGGCGQDRLLGARGTGVPRALQARHSERGTDGRSRGRWGFSRLEGTAGTGCQEGRAVAWARVDSVTVLQRGRDGEYERVCPDGKVYNLGVTPYHNYLANGVLVHNCHHAAAQTYLDLFERLREANPNLKHLGVTATPLRADGVGLRTVYQTESFHYGIREMVKMRYLVPPRWLAIQTGISLKGVASRNGDFVGKQLADVYETQNCFDLVVESHKKYADGRQCIAFVESVDGAYRLAETFREAGIVAEAADGATREADRADILTRFRKGETQVLCNVGLYTEGLDVPQVSCIHQVRPTKSDGLYCQMIGRGLRPVPEKDDCLILDYAPIEARNVCMLGDVLGVEIRKEAYIEEAEEPGEVVAGMTFDGEEKWLEGNPAEIISRQLDYLELSPFSWNRADGDGWMSLGLGEGSDKIERTLVVSPPDGEGFVCLYTVAKDKGTRSTTAEVTERGDFEHVAEVADTLIDRYANAILAKRNVQWRKQQATDAQYRFAKSLGVWQDGMSKGACAQAITHKLAMRAIQREERRGIKRNVHPAMPSAWSAA